MSRTASGLGGNLAPLALSPPPKAFKEFLAADGIYLPPSRRHHGCRTFAGRGQFVEITGHGRTVTNNISI
jgi:hypothetical protein